MLADEILGNKGSIKVPSQHVIQSESVSVYKELGEGEFGVVQQGVWTDEDGMRHQVAVKCLRWGQRTYKETIRWTLFMRMTIVYVYV